MSQLPAIRKLLQGLDSRTQRILTQAFELLDSDVATLAVSTVDLEDTIASPAFVIASGTTTPQSIPNNTVTPMTYETVTVGDETLITLLTTPHRLILESGLWHVTAFVTFDNASLVGQRAIRLTQATGVNSAPTLKQQSTSAGTASTMGVSALFPITTTSWITADAFQNSGGPLNATSRSIQAVRLGDLS